MITTSEWTPTTDTSANLSIGLPSPGSFPAATYTLDYSTNGGSSWTTIYDVTALRALTTDTVTLSKTQNLGAVQVRATVPALGGSNYFAMTFYESWLAVQG